MTRQRWHIYANLLVLAWLGAAAFVGFAHRGVPAPRWLLVHLLVLGGATTAIMIWSHHFSLTLLHRPDPPTRRAETLRLAGVTAGVLCVVGGVVATHWAWVVVGATLVAAAVIAHVVSLLRAMRRTIGARFAVSVRYYVAAGLLLPVGVTLGVLLAQGSASDETHGRLLAAHMVLNVLGWIGLTVLGTMVTLWPTLLRTRVAQTAERDARRALRLLLAGVVVAALAALAGAPLGVAAGLAGYAAGLVVAGRPLVDEVRRKPPSAFPAWSMLCSALWLLGVVVVLAAWFATADSMALGDALSWVTPAVLVGFVAQVLVAALSGLIPVVLGGGPSVLRRTMAAAERWGGARLVLTNVGLLLCLLPVPSAVRVLCSTLVLVALTVTVPLLLRATVVARRPADDEGRKVDQRPEAARLAGVAAGVAMVVLAVVGGVAFDPEAVGVGTTPAADASVVATGHTTTVEVSAAGMRFTPDSVDVPYGDQLVIVLTNEGDQTHDLVLDTGATSGRLAVGETATVDVGVVGRDVDGWCSVAGHRQMGMVFAINVVGAPDAGTAEPGGSPTPDASSPPDHSQHGTTGAIDPMAMPGDDFVAHDPTLPPLPKGRTHHVTFRVQEVEREVSPGVTMRVWTYNGQFPGPTLHGRVGDRFVITLINDGSIGHSIDFHAGTLAPDRPMRTIDPGEQLTYRFTAERSGIWMYHCSTMPMSLHIANGMFGAVVIDPPGLPPVDREYVLVQSELYLGGPDGITDADKLVAEQPDGVVFNGYAAQYDHRPLRAKVGERVRIWVLDAGPNRPSSFHVVGGQFDTVFTEGAYQLRPGNRQQGGAQVLPLMPAQGGFVELSFPQAGHYPFVSHLMIDAERGAHGIVHVTP